MATVFGEQAAQAVPSGGGSTSTETPRGRLATEDFSRYLERVTTIHSRLSRMVLNGDGIEALVVTLSHLLSRPTVVQDRFFKLLAASEGVEEELASAEVFEDPRVADRVKKIVQEHRPAQFPPFAELGMHRSRVAMTRARRWTTSVVSPCQSAPRQPPAYPNWRACSSAAAQAIAAFPMT